MQLRVPRVNDARDYIITAVLLLIAVTIMVQRYQGGLNSLRSVSLTVFSLLEEPLSNIRVYRQALRTNAYLQEQNILLQDNLNRLRSVERQNRELRKLLDLKESSPHDLMPVTIVGKELTGTNNMITIDQGSNNGIKVGMPLITSDGLVGRVIKVGPAHSQVMPFFNPSFNVSASIQELGNVGIVSWSDEEPNLLEMKHVSQTVKVDSGQVIATSGFSNTFPPNIQIGSVIKTEPVPGKDDLKIFLRPFVSLSTVAEGFIIKFEPVAEIDSLSNAEVRPGQ